MTDEWTPTTENVRFAFSGCVEVSEAQIRMKRHGAAFDRWLAAHDREVRAKALEDAARAYDLDFVSVWLHELAAAIREGTTS